MGRYHTPPGDGMEPIAAVFREQQRVTREAGRPSGTNIAQLVEKVRVALQNITATVVSATNNYLSTGTVTMNNVNAANVTTSGRVTSAAALRSPGSRAYVVQGGGLGSYAGGWIDGDGTVGISPSSIRFKTDIEQWVPDISRLLLLRAVLFRYDPAVFGDMDPDAPKQLGFIAEELDALGFPEFIFYDADGLIEGINYDRITVALLVLAQRQEARLQSMEARLEAAGL